MEATSSKRKRLPPRWFIRLAWAAHRAIYRVTGGRRGLAPARPGQWGTMRITTVGRKTGKTREVRARAAVGEERERLWARFREFGDDPDDYAHRRPGRTEVVVLEPASASGARPEGDTIA